MSGRWYRDVYRDAVWESETLTSAEKAVAETYARHARDEHGNKSAGADRAWLTYERIMSKAGIRRRANVSTAVAGLVDAGWLKAVVQVSRRATVYQLTIPTGSSDGGTTDEDGVDARSSDGGTTEGPSVMTGSSARSSTAGTTVVPLADHGSSTFASGSSDGGTQPLGPSKDHYSYNPSLSSSSDRDSLPTAGAADGRERDDGEDFQEDELSPANAEARELIAKHCGITDAGLAEQIIGGVEDAYQVRTIGFWHNAVRNGSIHTRVNEALQNIRAAIQAEQVRGVPGRAQQSPADRAVTQAAALAAKYDRLDGTNVTGTNGAGRHGSSAVVGNWKPWRDPEDLTVYDEPI